MQTIVSDLLGRLLDEEIINAAEIDSVAQTSGVSLTQLLSNLESHARCLKHSLGSRLDGDLVALYFSHSNGRCVLCEGGLSDVQRNWQAAVGLLWCAQAPDNAAIVGTIRRLAIIRSSQLKRPRKV